jgi:hypothetical protein
MQELTYSDVETRYPAAWEALPDGYKSDSCLEFFIDLNRNLCAEYDLGGLYIWTGKQWLEGDYE